MHLSRSIRVYDYKEKVSNFILQWSKGQETFLNVISLPYNSSIIFLKTILMYIKNNKRIIYITEEKENQIDILYNIKKYTNFRNYTYIRNIDVRLDSSFIVCNYNNAMHLNEKFDFIIYDDINSFPLVSNSEMKELILNKINNKGKVIVYSIESLFKGYSEITLPIKDTRDPVVEPRIVITRIDINKDIPYVVYEYLNWSIVCNRKIIIYVPDKEKVKSVFKYIKKYYSKLNNILYYIKNKNNKKVFLNFIRMKKGIIITNEFSDIFIGLKNTDIMVYFADNAKFNYKNLVFLSTKVIRDKKNLKGEVVFLAEKNNIHIDKAKNIIRNFNKEAWEIGLLNI